MALDPEIALGIRPPPDAYSTLGNIMNIAGGAQRLQLGGQALQLGGQQIQSGALNLQKQQELQEEFNTSTDWMKKNKDVYTNPDGTMNPEGLAKSDLPTIAPNLYPQIAKNISDLGSAQTLYREGKTNLTMAQKSYLGAFMGGALSTLPKDDNGNITSDLDTTKAAVNGALAQFKALFKGDPNAAAVADATSMFTSRAQDPQALVTAAARQRDEMLTPAQQRGGQGLIPAAGSVSLPQGAVPVVSTPATGAGGPTTTLSSTSPFLPAGQSQQWMTDSAGNLHHMAAQPGTLQQPFTGLPPIPGVPTTVGQTAAGGGAPAATAPVQPATPSPVAHPAGKWASPVTAAPAPTGGAPWTNQQQAASQQQAAAETKAAQQGALQIPVLRSNINEAFRLVDSGSKFGPGSDLYNSILGIGNMVSGGAIGGEAARYQTTGALMDRIALQQAQSLGQTTVAGTQLTAGATGTPAGFNKDAMREKLRIIDAQFAAQQAYTQGLMNHVGSGQNQNFANKAAYDASWTKALGTDGVDAFRIQGDLARGDTGDVDALVKATGKPMAYWKARAMQLDNLTGGGLSGRNGPPKSAPTQNVADW